MEQHNQTKDNLEELSKLYMFEEIYKFMRESPGIAITAAYMIMLLSSMAYLHVLYSAFDMSIVQYITLEDMLATPIKNPDIIIVFSFIVFILYTTDLGSRLRARQQLKYFNSKKPLPIKILHFILWTPKKRTANLWVTAATVMLCLIVYIVNFAKLEAEAIKEGEGTWVEITLAEEGTKVVTTLLGTSVNYIFTHDLKSDESIIYYVESIKQMRKVTPPTPDEKTTTPDVESKVEKSPTIESADNNND